MARSLNNSVFPVFRARGLCIRGTGKDYGARGWINQPTLFVRPHRHPGDLSSAVPTAWWHCRVNVPPHRCCPRRTRGQGNNVLERLQEGEQRSDLQLLGPPSGSFKGNHDQIHYTRGLLAGALLPLACAPHGPERASSRIAPCDHRAYPPAAHGCGGRLVSSKLSEVWASRCWSTTAPAPAA